MVPARRYLGVVDVPRPEVWRRNMSWPRLLMSGGTLMLLPNWLSVRQALMVIVCFTIVGTNTSCARPSSEEQPQATAEPRSTQGSRAPASPVSARLLWSHFGKAFDDDQAIFVVRVSNAGDTAVSGVTFEIQALDVSGTVVGSGEATTPDLSPRGHFDYLGTLGGTAFSELTGRPAKVEVSMGSGSVQESRPPLTTSEVGLKTGAPSFTDAPYAYDLTVKVTNNTGETLRTPVHQQVILYAANGQIVGGGQGSSDNQPATLTANRSYREEWTGIPAFKPATTARYSVWPER